MFNIFGYLVNVSACTAIFYLFYLLFFSNDTFYVRNRVYLLSILILSTIIPVIKAFPSGSSSDSFQSSGLIAGVIVSGNQIGSAVAEQFRSFDFHNLILCVYLTIMIVLFFRSVYGIVKALRIIKKGTILDNRFPKIVLSDSDEYLFSFFHFVVIPEKLYVNDNYMEVLEHEKVHVRQRHTFDLLLCEILVALQWFNPFIWFIRRSIILNHEYLADNISIKESKDKRAYQYKLINIPVQLSTIQLTHCFSSSIKKRLIMINKKPTRSYAALKGFLVIPVVAILFLVFSFRTESVSSGSAGQESPFSESSTAEIFEYISSNITYPEGAKNACDTGLIYINVKMGKGGVVKECNFVSGPDKIKVPFIGEFVIVGYRPSQASGTINNTDHSLLKSEGIRIVKNLGTVDIPEWKDKDVEFALAFKFSLKSK